MPISQNKELSPRPFFLVELLLRHGHNMVMDPGDCERYGLPLESTWLHYYASIGDKEKYLHLVELCYKTNHPSIIWSTNKATLVPRESTPNFSAAFRYLMDQLLKVNRKKIDQRYIIKLLKLSSKHHDIILNNKCERLFHLACRHGWIGVVKKLITTIGVDFNKPNSRGQTGLQIALAKGYETIPRLLLEAWKNGDINLDVDGLTDPRNVSERLFYHVRSQLNHDHELLLKLGGMMWGEGFNRAANISRVDGHSFDVDEYFISHIQGLEEAIYREAIKLKPGFIRPDAVEPELADNSPRQIATGRGNDELIRLLQEAVEVAQQSSVNLSPPVDVSFTGDDNMIEEVDHGNDSRKRKAHFEVPIHTPSFFTSSTPSTLALESWERDDMAYERPEQSKKTRLILTPSVEDVLLFKDSLVAGVAELNRRVKVGESVADLPFVIAHFRGLNYSRKNFTQSEQRRLFPKQARQKPIYSLACYDAADLSHGHSPSPEQEPLLKSSMSDLRALWAGLGKIKPYQQWWRPKSKAKKRVFETMQHAFQQRYTNVAGKTNKGAGIPEEIWRAELWQRVRNDGCYNRDLREVIGRIPKRVQSNMLVSTGKLPQHGIRYVLGFSLAPHTRDKRADAKYRRSGQSKHKRVGCIYTIMHPVQVYLDSQPSDCMDLNYRDKMSFGGEFGRYRNETEVSFPGGIEEEYVAACTPTQMPDFEYQWRELALEEQEDCKNRFGLTEEVYTDFRTKLRNTVRPINDFPDVFERRQWRSDDVQNRGIHRQHWQAFQVLLGCKDLPEGTDKSDWAALLDIDKLDGKSQTQLKNELKDKFRALSPYRVVKDEIREHLVEHLAEIEVRRAKDLARQRNRHLVYRLPNGEFKLFTGTAKEVHAEVVGMLMREKRRKPLQAIPKTPDDTNVNKNAKPNTMMPSSFKAKKMKASKAKKGVKPPKNMCILGFLSHKEQPTDSEAKRKADDPIDNVDQEKRARFDEPTPPSTSPLR